MKRREELTLKNPREGAKPTPLASLPTKTTHNSRHDTIALCRRLILASTGFVLASTLYFFLSPYLGCALDKLHNRYRRVSGKSSTGFLVNKTTNEQQNSQKTNTYGSEEKHQENELLPLDLQIEWSFEEDTTTTMTTTTTANFRADLFIEVVLVPGIGEPHEKVRHDLHLVQQPRMVQLLEAAIADTPCNTPPSNLQERSERQLQKEWDKGREVRPGKQSQPRGYPPNEGESPRKRRAHEHLAKTPRMERVLQLLRLVCTEGLHMTVSTTLPGAQ